ncbi:Uncharacterised protein [Haploplasma axanthum]|uniref:Uncharacterized protein n=2 Tax=Haploplasma axanthum TaxID=29552 RepID=A0A449BBK2_HAPAX|nr:hypothetical protein [Haploplasma axanthum]VEU79823.1 Uncharacterised protein [Haploplasma axanthum]
MCKKIFLEQNNLSDIFEHISDFNNDIDNFVIKNLKLVKDILKEKMKKNSIKDQLLIEKLDNKYMYLIEKFDYDDKEIINLTIEEAKIEILKQKAKSYQDEYLEAKVDTDKYENLVSEVTRVKEKNNK